MNQPPSQGVPRSVSHIAHGAQRLPFPSAGSHEVNDIHFSEDARRLRIWWKNSKLRLSVWPLVFLGLFWIFWMPATLLATKHLFIGDDRLFFAVWCIFGWTGTVFIPLLVVRRYTGGGSIELDAAEVSFCGDRLLSPKRVTTLPLASVSEIMLGQPEHCAADQPYEELIIYGREGLLPGTRSQHTAAPWVPIGGQLVIFERLREFATKRGLPVNFVLRR
jgi:hypothetical protein